MSDVAARTAPPDRIPVTLVTGFLGAGKTSLINRALRSPEMANTVVVINEFGEVALDHLLTTASDDAVVVLENGCLCCTVRSDLVRTLNDLYHARTRGEVPRFDAVVIETSGLAEPGPVVQAFLSEPTLDGLYRVAGVVTLIDAVNAFDTFRRHDEAVRQAALADHVVLTKLDLVEADEAVAREAELRALVRRINPAAAIDRLDDPAITLAGLLRREGFDPADRRADPRPWLALERYEAAHRPMVCDDPTCDDPAHDHAHHGPGHHGHRHAHGDGDPFLDRGIESFCLVRDEPLTRGALQFLLDGISQNLGPGLLRVKGLVNVAEEPGRPAVIQGAQHLLHTMTWLDHWPDADERSRVVFITQGISRDALRDIVELLDRVAARTARARLAAAAVPSSE